MKRGKKLLLLLAVLVIVGGAALAALKLFPDGEAVENAEAPAAVILSLSAGDLTSFAWTYGDSETLSFEKTETGWSYTPDPAFPVNETRLSSVLGRLAEVAASKTIESPADTAQYGLDAPACEVSARTADGENFVLRIGSENEMGGERYVSIGDGNVYLTDASLLDSFSAGLYDLVLTESIPYMPEVNALTVQAETQTLAVERLPDSGLAYSDAYVWFMREGGDFLALDTELTEDLVESVSLMYWSRCVDYAADDAALAAYGLADPAAVVTVDYTSTVQTATNRTDDSGNAIYETERVDGTFVLELGAYAGDSACYARLPGSRMVYEVSASILDGLLYTGYDELRPDEVLSVDWSRVTGVELTAGSETHTLTRELSPVDADAADDGDDYDDVELGYEVAWMLDGARADIEDAYAALTSMKVQAYADGVSPARGEELRVLIRQTSESWPEIELIFYQYDSTRDLAVRDGTAMFVNRSDVQELLDLLAAAFAPAEE